MPKNLASPNDSLQQSTREPSTRLSDRTSLDATSQSITRRFLTGSSQMGGGSYKSYLMEHLGRMHSDIEATTRKLELEQRRLFNLDKLVTTAESEWGTKREKYKITQAAADGVAGQKADTVRVLERKLVKAIEDLNKGNCDNEQLREQIDQLRKERTILDCVFKTMEKEINSNKKLLEKEKSKINESKFSCDEAKQKARALNKMLERERRDFKDEITKIGVKAGKLEVVSRSQDSAGAKGKNKKAYMVADEEEAFSEPAMHRRILKLSFLNTIQRRHIKQHQKNIEVFEQAFATIKSTTGISDIDEIVKIFVALEQRNFSLLTYVNELNREIETIEIRNRELQDQLKTYRQEQTQSEVRKKDALSELSVQISKTKAATEEKDKMVKDSAEALNDCRPLIWNIVRNLKQNLPALLHAGYEGDPPPMKIATPDEHEENLNNYLMYVEEAVLQFRVSLTQDVQPLRPQPPRNRETNARPQRPAELPSAHITGDDSDDDPDTGLGDRPWTRTELRDKAQEMIKRRKRKQHGKLIGEDKRTDGVEETLAEPAKNAATASTSRESKENDSGLSKSPSMSSKQDRPDASPEDGARGDRPENWWRGKGEETVTKMLATGK